jgi:myo-inositol 2-dehydrogenase / D-chiro-inositol 1-dehydrogenase
MDKKQLRGAVIGYGFISSRGHIPVYQERNRTLGDVKIVAVADICPIRRSSARDAVPEAKIYSDYRGLLEREATRLDFVDIATPPYEHAAIARAALLSGVHVLCEKPLACTIEEARVLLDHAKHVKRVIFPCHNYKHAPMIKMIREIVQSGRIGKVRSVTLNTYRNTHARGVREWNSHWRRERQYSGGGIAMDHGSHSLYLAFDWLGSYPTAVTAKMSNLEPGKYDTEDEFTAVLDFPTGVAHVHLTWTAGIRKVIYTVRGEKGVVTMEDDDLQVEISKNGHIPGRPAMVEKKSISSHWEDASRASWFNLLFDEFREAIERRDFAGKDAQEALLCVELINTAYRSAREGSRQLRVPFFARANLEDNHAV